MKTLLLALPGLLTESQRKKMERQGCIVVETTNFEGFKLINAEFFVAADQFAIAALETLCEGSYSGEKFAKKILAVMKAKG